MHNLVPTRVLSFSRKRERTLGTRLSNAPRACISRQNCHGQMYICLAFEIFYFEPKDLFYFVAIVFVRLLTYEN